MNRLTASFVVLFSSALVAQTTQTAKTTYDARVSVLQLEPQGPFVQLDNGSLLCLVDDKVQVSEDGGKTWSGQEVLVSPRLNARPEQGAIRMRDGTIVFLFLDDLDKRWSWDESQNRADGDVHLFVWSIRSTDNGKTWTDLHRVQNGYCGAIRDIIETDNGRLIVPVQKFDPELARHVTIPYISDDSGKTWKPTTLLDIDGRGHHDGALEATLVQRKDQSIWMLLRSNRGFLYESISHDNGSTWSQPAAMQIDASSSPALIKRLASGRLVLIWNREIPSTGEAPARRGGQNAVIDASWHRAELSIAFSEDEGTTWSPPAILATRSKAWLSYPYLLERTPGELWITTMQGDLRMKIQERDFISSDHSDRK